jgi:hypothetical protein
MPPPNVFVFSTAMAVVVPPLATILLLLSTFIPPTMTPLSRMPPPLRKALLMTEMPPGPIVPVLVTPPLKVVWLITIAAVLPLKTVGYGPLNAIGALPRRYCAETQRADRAHPHCCGAGA